MRKLKKSVTDFLCCRMKTSTIIIILFVILFVAGNSYFLLPFFNRSLNNEPVTPTSFNSDVKVIIKDQDEKPVQNKDNENDIFKQKFDEYKKQAMQEIEKLPDVKDSREDFHVRFETLHPQPKTEKVKDNKKKQSDEIRNQLKKDGKINMAVLVISCNRPSVGRCLDKIFKYKPADTNIPVIVSQDCGHEATAQVIRSYGENVTHIKQLDLGDVKDVPPNMKRFMGYYKISRHFKFALTTVFKDWPIDSVVIVEDDIDIAPDFFEYFLATKSLLDVDHSLYCVSAWNDNGKPESIDKSAIDLVHRSDFFPGLGWLITRRIWEELGPKWPAGFWDDWMRAPEQRKNRACIRPEISRTKTFGRIGVSQGQFYDRYLKYIVLNENPYPFRDIDLSYLKQENYDRNFLDTVYASPESSPDKINAPNPDGSEEPIRITYRGNQEIEMLTRKIGLMTDLKAGVPRTAYKGVVSFYRNGRRIYLAPPRDWNGYKE